MTVEQKVLHEWHCNSDFRSTESVLDFALAEVAEYIENTKTLKKGQELSAKYTFYQDQVRADEITDEQYCDLRDELDDEVREYLEYDLPSECADFVPDGGEFGYHGDQGIYGMVIFDKDEESEDETDEEI